MSKRAIEERDESTKKRRLFVEGDDPRASATSPYFKQWNWSEVDRKRGNLNECTLHSLNSTLVNCLGVSPVSSWEASGIPQKTQRQVWRKESKKWRTLSDTVWYKSLNQSSARGNEVNANFAQVFKAIDPSADLSKVVTLRGKEFYEWSRRGKMTPDFKYA